MTKTARTNAQYNDKVITKMTLIQEIIKTIRKTKKNTHAYIYIQMKNICPPSADVYRGLPAERPAANPPPHATAAVDRWDRQTDGRTTDRCIDPAPHTICGPVDLTYELSLSRVEDTLGCTLTPAASGMYQFTQFTMGTVTKITSYVM